MQPFRRFSPDAVIFFSDILVPVQAMGVRVEFGERGPEDSDPIRDRRRRRSGCAASIRRGELRFTGEILRRLRAEVGDAAAVVGFAGAPWTLASYLVEGGASKSSRRSSR